MEHGENIKKNSLFSVSLTYGLLTAIGLIMVSLLSYLFDLSGIGLIFVLTYGLILAGIILGMLRYRDDDLQGFISYGKALGAGTLISVFAALISGIFMLFFNIYIAPEAMEAIKQNYWEVIIEAYPDITEKQFNVFLYSFTFVFGVLGVSVMGFIFSLVSATFIQKKDPLEV